MTLSAASVRASVERGDPFALDPFLVMLRCLPTDADGYFDPSALATATHPPEADPPQPVAADPQTLDTQSDGDYLDRVHPAHPVDSDSPPHMAEVREAHRAGWSEQDRLAFLARVQRIDPRERRS